MSADSAPIPVPRRRRWTLWAHRFAPLVVFLIIAAVCTQLWRTRIVAPTFVARVESTTSTVRTPVAGQLTLAPGLEPLAAVTAGQVLGWVEPLPPAQAQAELTIRRRELAALRANHAPTLDLRRIELDAARLQLEWLQARVELADLSAQLRIARDTVQRFETLQPSGSIAEQQHELARAELEGLDLQVATQAAEVQRLTPTLQHLDVVASDLPADAAALAADLAVQQARLSALELRLAPQPLLAPFAGVVLDAQASGAQLQAGDSAATLGAATASRIIGYEREPVTLDVAVGETVMVSTRRLPRQSAPATLLAISPTLEPVPANVLGQWRSTLPESGRRYQFSLPADLGLLPGEQVEVTLATR